MKKLLSFTFLMALVFCLFLNCSKDDDDNNSDAGANQFYVLCQGSWGAGNGSIVAYDLDSKTHQEILELGDVVTHGEIEGKKLVAACAGTHNVVVVNTENNSVIRNISLENSSPQAAVIENNKIYVPANALDSVIVLSLENYSRIASIPCGDDPYGAVGNGTYLFVANSEMNDDWTYNQGTVSVIDLQNDTFKQNITVGINPTGINYSNGFAYVMCTGDYSSVNSMVYKIDASSFTVTDSLDLGVMGAMKVIVGENNDLFSQKNYAGGLFKYNESLAASSLETFLDYGAHISYVSGYTIVTSNNGDFSSPGKIYFLDADNNKTDSVTVGVGTDMIVH